MRLKTHDAVGMFAGSLMILAGSLPGTSTASILYVSTTEMNLNRPYAARPLSSGAPVHARFADFSMSDAPAAYQSGVSPAPETSEVPEVDGRTLLAVILGLIGMGLWRGGRKTLPIIK